LTKRHELLDQDEDEEDVHCMATVNNLLIESTLEPPWAPASPVDETGVINKKI